ncbi:OmpA family protein [Luteitalea sp. TBR-22]|uniref:OmpA family protein n=1 Tax=Luteitalea sp. TBR-22 TaxID=2802971 RepID=UPI001AF6E9B2|nr:OmpA family protein [Luteitalea sp. TBR-22]
MTRLFRVGLAATMGLAMAAPAGFAQQQAGPAPAPAASLVVTETRTAAPTFQGDTGLWFVPLGEVLPAGRWSASAYYTNFDRQEGFTNIGFFPLTFGYGVGGRAELFASVSAVTRIDRDIRPVFVPGNEAGGPNNEYPLVKQPWSGSTFGDIYAGGKVALTSQAKGAPVAMALKAMVKLPTGSADKGTSSGQADFFLDYIVSKEVNERVDLSGYAGVAVRADAERTNQSNGLRYGFGLGFPTRSGLKLTAELFGESYFDDTLTSSGLTAFDGSTSAGTWAIKSPLDAAIGATYFSSKGFFAGAGVTYALKHDSRNDLYRFQENEGLDKVSMQFRIGYHPGVATAYVAPAPPPPPPPPPAVQENRPPTVKARCNPCTVEVGKSSTITADASDPDGDPLTYKWSCPAGTVAQPSNRETLWTAPAQEGPVPCTVTVTDGKGGTVTDTVTIQVVKPAIKDYTFEDVHFDFDRYTLRPEATRILDEAIKALTDNPELRIEVEGHTCNIGTAEYNLALGERRAYSVRDYLGSRGIGANRIRTVSYGEERPKHDNSREETRRLNRRAALTVRVTQ